MRGAATAAWVTVEASITETQAQNIGLARA
jgi:hypothetical protein